ncbi:3-hydroxyacyl-CoA dehydrogenase family protein [Alteromonas sp. a30]|uniref:3-hydroxyacyl-CoA dehydrogenase family protein n=1 Tax=Alteromonas sp. a30 TaxID=2730917 RepID=UPI00227DAF4B|nr:3-hydroxyacyl-CoA dehydrogenase family protein [Alteromonas sp. a30]MCY7295204.1 3-hydroxyacyl-CoA dehydrogenase family protein [Alteromonas sp. a30]
MRVAVVGAGTMGRDIALNLAAFGIQTILKDTNPAALDEARTTIRQNLRLYKMTNPAYKAVSKDDLDSLIQYTVNYDDFSNLDWVIENVPEEWALKEQVYKELAEVCSKETAFGVNTSCISITKVAALMPQPGNVIGMHFMNPVPMKPAVETVKGFHTSDDTISRAKALLKAMGKKMILVNDFPGFVANRLSHLFMNEAAFLVQDQVADPVSIDAVFKEGYGHAMGPLETADLIGLDTVVSSLKVLYDSYQDPKFRCCPLLQKMVDAGLLGKKSGRGFYQY